MKGVAFALVAFALIAGANADAKSTAQAYFKKHFPNKLEKMDALFEKYVGKEGDLMKTLIRERATLVVTKHYAKYNPAKGSKVQEMIAASNDYDALIKNMEGREKKILAEKKKIETWYRTNDMSDKIFDGSVDNLLQKNYGREDKIMSKLQNEGLTDGLGQKIKPKTFSKWFGGYIDLAVAGGLFFCMFLAYNVLLPMADKMTGVGGSKAEKKEKKSGKGSNKKKR
jgi:hypothetical protein